MTKVEIVIIPYPGLSHLVSTVEMAKLLLRRDGRLSITVLIMKFPNDTSVLSYTRKTSSPRLRLLDLPDLHDTDSLKLPLPPAVQTDFIDKHTAHVREAISNLIKKAAPDDSKLAGLVLDMFCTKFVEIGREFGLKSYVFFTPSAAGLGLSEHVAEMRFERNQTQTQYRNSDVELSVPYFKSPLPVRVLPGKLTEGGAPADDLLASFKRMREMQGIMVNTFYELESYAIDALNSEWKTPRVYPVGPVLNLSSQTFDDDDDDDVKKWLDGQDEDSVVFLCFGSMGSLDEAQVREIALALEKSGCPFLWSLRNLEEVVLPEGFLERTKGVGKVIGWAAQVAVLAHAAVGGFVSHCGWNSILESVWFGVPIATFPLYAEQQMNAFQLVKELGLAEMIRLDYRMGRGEIVGWEEIAAAIRRVMAADRVREKVKEMQRKARAAFVEGGSSYIAHTRFIEDVIENN